MNKKLLAGLSALVATGAFWACGEGNINKYDEMDGIVADQYTTPEQRAELKKKAIESCKADSLGCALTYADYLKDPDAPMSSEGDVASSESTVNSSSDGTIPKSSAGWVIKSSSSSVGGTDPVGSSSSAGGVVVTGLGGCAPAKATIEKNGSVAWNFTPNLSEGSMQDFLGASYSWNFGSDGDGTGMTSSPVTYGTSGKKTATVTVTMGMKNSVIECSPLQVNGDPITGCECTAPATSVDFTATPDVTWSVTGCTTASLPLNYEWEGSGTPGELASFTKTFTEAQPGYTPTLKVGNSDNTIIEVPCTKVKTTNGAEYKLTSSNEKVTFSKSGSFSISAELPERWHNDDQTCTVYCNGSSSDYVVTIDEIELSGRAANNTYVAVQSKMLVAHTIGGYTMSVDVEIAAGDSVSCGVNW